MAPWWEEAPLATESDIATLEPTPTADYAKSQKSFLDEAPLVPVHTVVADYEGKSNAALVQRAREHALSEPFENSDVHGPRPRLNTPDVEKQATEHLKQFPGVNPIEAALVYQRAKHYYRLAAASAGDIEPSGQRKRLGSQTITESKITSKPAIQEGENLEQLQKHAAQVPPEDRPMFLGIMSDYMTERQKKAPQRTFSEKFLENVNRGVAGVPNSMASLPKYFGGDEKAADDWRFMQQIRGIKEGYDPATTDNWIGKGLLAAARMAPPMLIGGMAGSGIGAGVGALAGEAAGGVAGGVAEIGFWGGQEAPGMYEEMRQQGINHDTAAKLAIVTAPIIGGIEAVQVGQAAKPFEKEAKAMAKKAFAKKLAVKLAKTNFKENVEENLQSAVSVAARAYGTYLDKHAKDIDWSEEIANFGQSAFETALAMPFIQGPGAVVGGAKDYRKNLKLLSLESAAADMSARDKAEARAALERMSEAGEPIGGGLWESQAATKPVPTGGETQTATPTPPVTEGTPNAGQITQAEKPNGSGSPRSDEQSASPSGATLSGGGQGGGEIPGQVGQPEQNTSKEKETEVNPYHPLDARHKTWQPGQTEAPAVSAVKKTVGELPVAKPEDARDSLWKDAQAIASDPNLPEIKGTIVEQAVDKAARAGLLETREDFDHLLDQLAPHADAPIKEQAKRAAEVLNQMQNQVANNGEINDIPGNNNGKEQIGDTGAGGNSGREQNTIPPVSGNTVPELQNAAKQPSFSSTQINLPEEIAEQVVAASKKIPDADLAEDGRETEPHVTVKYGLHTNEAEHVRKLIENEPPIKAKLGKASVFPATETGGTYDVVKLDVDSPDLHRINKLISDSLSHTDTHPNYHPHVTLAYVKPGLGEKHVGMADLEGQELTVDRIIFSDKDRNHVEVVLKGKPAEPKKSLGGKNSAPENSYGTVETPNREALGEQFGQKLASGGEYKNINEARQEAGKLLGGDVKPGTQAAKSVDEAVEQGVVRAARRVIERGMSSELTYELLINLYERQPSLNVRTSTSMREQAYSTPAPLAFIASHLAGVDENSIAYDSSAGNGMLLIGAKVANARANELNRERAAALRSQGIETTNRDATKYRPSEQANAVVINPPFGRVMDESGKESTWDVEGVETNQVDHAIALNSLPAMKADGKAVVILGAKGGRETDELSRAKSYSNASVKKFYDKIYDTYNVTDHFTVSGDLYSKQGAGFPVDVLVIDGVGGESRPRPWNLKENGLPKVYTSWEELKNDKLANQTNARAAANGQTATGLEPGAVSPGGVNPTERNPNDLAGVSKPAEAPAVVAGTEQPGPGARSAEAVPAGVGGSHGTDTPAEAGVPAKPRRQRRVSGNAGGQRPTPGSVPNASESQSGGSGEPAATATAGGLSSERATKPGSVTENQVKADTASQPFPKGTKKHTAAENRFQVPYAPKSAVANVDTLLPRNHVDAVERALESVAERYGDLDAFVAKELGFPVDTLGEKFAAEQVDALALAIANQKAGQGFILGDQTGVGKGRAAAGLIRYAQQQGLLPVFVTEKPNLYGDIMRDLIDIGMSTEAEPFNALMTNSISGDDKVILPDGRELSQSPATAQKTVTEALQNYLAGNGLTTKTRSGEEKYGAVFTTYSQLQSVGGKTTWRQDALQQAKGRAFFILDESHNAGGTKTEDDRTGKSKAPGRAEVVRDLIATSPGVYYSSATFAKRPEVMDLYARAGLGKAVANSDDLAAAINAGGVPLQQVVSEMLAEAGQYLRRERSFDGVEFASKTTKIDLVGADKVSEIFRGIQDFDLIKDEAVKTLDREVTSEGGSIGRDDSTGQGGVDSTNFTSILHNIVDQQLVALKSDAVADEAIAAWKRGETPVIAIDNTMEAALGHYLSENPTAAGEPVTFNFRNLLQRYLDRTREITVKQDRSDPSTWTRRTLTDEELGEDGVRIFKDVQDKIEGFDADLPASPIDWIRYRLEQAGMKVAEITGREKMIEYAGNMHEGVLKERPESESGVAGRVRTIAGLNNGEIDAVVLNRSGATGVSMHSSSKFKNQRQRHMVIAQAAKNIDEFMQMLGRIHRTGQVNLPKYTLLMSDAPAENRPAAVLTKKLASLNANVTGASSGAVGFEASDILNKVGDEVVSEYVSDNRDLNTKLGEPVHFTMSGRVENQDDIARKVTGRVALLTVAEQEQFWDDITSLYDNKIEELDALGNNPLTAKTLPLQAKTLEKFPISEGNEESANPFEHPSYLEKISAKQQGKPFKSAEVETRLRLNLGVENLDNVKGAQKAWLDKFLDGLKERGQKFATKRIEEAKTDAAADALKEQFDKQFATIHEAVNTFPIGKPVHYQAWFGVMEGVVTGIRQTGKGKNPLAPSTWVADIYVNSAVRKVSVPLTQLREDAENSVQPVGQYNLPEFIENFDKKVSDAREERYVATGNLLAGYAALQDQKGQIAFFTDDKDQVRRGILMPVNFDAASWQEARPVTFEDGATVLKFLDKGGNTLFTPDKMAWVSQAGDNLVVRSYKARSRGGKFTTDSKLLAAASPAEFVSKGSIMEMVVPKKQSEAVLDRLIQISPLQANSDRELARDVISKLGKSLGDKAESKGSQDKGPSEGGGGLLKKGPSGTPNGPAPAAAPITESANIMRISSGGPSLGLGVVGKATGILQKYMTSRGNLTQEVFDRKVRKDGSIAAEMAALRFQGAAFEDSLKKATGSVKLSESGRKLVDQALKGDHTALNQLPAEVQKPVLEMRQHIDTLSRRLIDNGLAEGDLEVSIDQNMGTYVTRSYKVFDDPDWNKKVAPEVRNKAFLLLQQENPNASDADIRDMIDEMLDRDKSPLVSGRRLGAKDLSITKARKDIAPEIRALLGEYDDPLVNYTRSVTKMAYLAANHEFLTDVRLMGMGTLFFEKGDLNRPADFNKVFSSDTDKAMAPLNGLMTSEAIRDAFQQTLGKAAEASFLMRWYMKAVVATKYSKTVLSPVTQVRNFISNANFALQNGHMNLLKLSDATKTTKEALRAELPAVLRSAISSDAAWQERYKHYVSLGVVDESVQAGELRSAISDATRNIPTEVANSPLYQLGSKAFSTVEAVYQASDNFWKVFAFENERARYKKAWEDSGKKFSDAVLDQTCAKIVRDTYPTYSMTPEAVKQLRKNPIIAPFVSFAAESWRTYFKTAVLAKSEIQDPALRAIGATRAAGLAAATALPFALAYASRFLIGASGDDDDDLRFFLPPWSKNSYIFWLWKNSGNIGWLDAGAFFPNATLFKPVMAYMQGEDWKESLYLAAKEFMTPYIGEELFAEKLIDLKRNQTSTGSQVYNSEAPVQDQIAAGIGHLWTAFEPGILSSLNRIRKAYDGTVEKGRTYNLRDEILAPLTGIRFQATDIANALGHNAYRYDERLDKSTSIFTRSFSTESTQDPTAVKAAYIKANAARKAAFEDMHEQTRAALAFGVSRESVLGSLSAAGVSKAGSELIIRGQYEPYIPSHEIIEKVERLPGGAGRIANFIEAFKTVDGVGEIVNRYENERDHQVQKLYKDRIDDYVSKVLELPGGEAIVKDQLGSELVDTALRHKRIAIGKRLQKSQPQRGKDETLTHYRERVVQDKEQREHAKRVGQRARNIH